MRQITTTHAAATLLLIMSLQIFSSCKATGNSQLTADPPSTPKEPPAVNVDNEDSTLGAEVKVNLPKRYCEPEEQTAADLGIIDLINKLGEVCRTQNQQGGYERMGVFCNTNIREVKDPGKFKADVKAQINVSSDNKATVQIDEKNQDESSQTGSTRNTVDDRKSSAEVTISLSWETPLGSQKTVNFQPAQQVPIFEKMILNRLSRACKGEVSRNLSK